MTPLLFITLVTAVLLILLYWILSTLDFQEKGRKKGRRPSYHFETAQELFKYVEPDYELVENSIKLTKTSPNYVIVCWNLSQEKWNESRSVQTNKPDVEDIILRLLETSKQFKILDIPVNSLLGKYEFKLENNTTWYASLGFVNNESFNPILTSNKISTNSGINNEDFLQ